MSFKDYLKENDQTTRNLQTIIQNVLDNSRDWKINKDNIPQIVYTILGSGILFKNKEGRPVGGEVIKKIIIDGMKSSILTDEQTDKIVKDLQQNLNLIIRDINEPFKQMKDKQNYQV